MRFYTFYYFDCPAKRHEQFCHLDNNTILVSAGDPWPDAHAAESHGPHGTNTLHQTPKNDRLAKRQEGALKSFTGDLSQNCLVRPLPVIYTRKHLSGLYSTWYNTIRR